jgi:S1-C subfamily serine protease
MGVYKELTNADNSLKRSKKKTSFAMMVNDGVNKVMVMDVVKDSPASKAGFKK